MAERRQSGPGTREGQALDRPGPQGGFLDRRRPLFARPCRPPTPAPPRGFRGPLRCLQGLPEQSGLAGYTPVLPTRITHPVYPPWYPPGAHAGAQRRCWTMPGTTGTCTYDQFGDTVGEPRGTRTHRYFRVPGWFIQVYWFTRPYDWVLTLF